MTLSATLSSALSGLTAASRAAGVVSSNVANAMTEGYGRREIELSARRVGNVSMGVEVIGTTRRVNQTLLSDRRVADAGAADQSVRQAFLKRIEGVLGETGATGSLSSRVAAFDAALITAAGRPDAEANLTVVLDAARTLAGSISTAAADVQTARTQADRRIAAEVEMVNSTLQQLAEMNTQIRAMAGTGQDASALMDQRQQLVDQIATIVPLREVYRDHGQIALYTTNGAVLLDGRPAELGFTPVGLITPDMTLASGALSGLTLNGQPVPTDGPAGFLAGGSIGANFAIRDDLAPDAQAKLDAVARDLIERFQDPILDSTLAPGDAGLFTDIAAAFDPLNETGLAQRLRLNASVDPVQGGALWRLRDGIGAVVPGPSGHSGLLSALQDRLVETRLPASGGFLPGARSFAGLVSEFTSDIATARLTAETDASFASGKADALRQAELEQGVDTDQELQSLLEIERMYAANARVIQTVDAMIQQLMEI